MIHSLSSPLHRNSIAQCIQAPATLAEQEPFRRGDPDLDVRHQRALPVGLLWHREQHGPGAVPGGQDHLHQQWPVGQHRAGWIGSQEQHTDGALHPHAGL